MHIYSHWFLDHSHPFVTYCGCRYIQREEKMDRIPRTNLYLWKDSWKAMHIYCNCFIDHSHPLLIVEQREGKMSYERLGFDDAHLLPSLYHHNVTICLMWWSPHPKIEKWHEFLEQIYTTIPEKRCASTAIILLTIFIGCLLNHYIQREGKWAMSLWSLVLIPGDSIQ